MSNLANQACLTSLACQASLTSLACQACLTSLACQTCLFRLASQTRLTSLVYLNRHCCLILTKVGKKEEEKEKVADSMPRHFPEEMAEAKMGLSCTKLR